MLASPKAICGIDDDVLVPLTAIEVVLADSIVGIIVKAWSIGAVVRFTAIDGLTDDGAATAVLAFGGAVTTDPFTPE